MLSALKRLSGLVEQRWQSAQAERRIATSDLPLLFELLSHTKSYRWKSAYFRKGKGVSLGRAEEVVDLVFYDAKARKEVKRAIDRMGGPGGALFWDLYLRRVVNAVMGFSDGYLSLLNLAHSALPTASQLVDWNSGTGNLAAALALGSADRKISAVDSNPRAVIATKRVLKHFFPDKEHSITAKLGDPLAKELSIPVSKGAVLMNSLFLAENESIRLEILKEIHANLQDDGVFFLVEPKPWLAKQSVLRLWVQRVAKSAAASHSPMSEFELAIFTEMQRVLFLEVASEIRDTSELVALCKTAGFEPLLVRDGFYGYFSTILLKKVPVPTAPKKEPVIRYHDEPWPT